MNNTTLVHFDNFLLLSLQAQKNIEIKSLKVNEGRCLIKILDLE